MNWIWGLRNIHAEYWDTKSCMVIPSQFSRKKSAGIVMKYQMIAGTRFTWKIYFKKQWFGAWQSCISLAIGPTKSEKVVWKTGRMLRRGKGYSSVYICDNRLEANLNCRLDVRNGLAHDKTNQFKGRRWLLGCLHQFLPHDLLPFHQFLMCYYGGGSGSGADREDNAVACILLERWPAGYN